MPANGGIFFYHVEVLPFTTKAVINFVCFVLRLKLNFCRTLSALEKKKHFFLWAVFQNGANKTFNFAKTKIVRNGS